MIRRANKSDLSRIAEILVFVKRMKYRSIFHWHLFPRRTGDIDNYGNKGKGPAWCYPSEKMYADINRPSKEELEEMKAKLLCELDKLL